MHASFDANALLSLDFFLKRWMEVGAEYTALPWTCSEIFLKATSPHPEKEDRSHADHYLVASGEQSFCEMATKSNFVNNKMYIGWTPCFRNEPRYSDTHHHYFLKAEVFCTTSEEKKDIVLLKIVNMALKIFNERLAELSSPWKAVSLFLPRENQFDILVGGVEVGSYGIRQHPTLLIPYVFATAVAEPRFSFAVSRKIDTCLKDLD